MFLRTFFPIIIVSLLVTQHGFAMQGDVKKVERQQEEYLHKRLLGNSFLGAADNATITWLAVLGGLKGIDKVGINDKGELEKMALAAKGGLVLAGAGWSLIKQGEIAAEEGVRPLTYQEKDPKCKTSDSMYKNLEYWASQFSANAAGFGFAYLIVKSSEVGFKALFTKQP